MKAKLSILIAILMIGSMLFAACQPATPAAEVKVEPTKASVPPTEKPAPTTAPVEPTVAPTEAPVATEAPAEPVIKRGGILKISLEADPTDLDPATNTAAVDTQVQNMVYEGLVTWNPETLAPEPLLAKSWEIAEDGMTYTFHLQEGVKWSNGDPFVAADVKFTIDRITSGALTDANYLSSIDNVEAVDDLTVVFHMKEPYAPMLTNAPMVPLIQNKKFVEENKGATTRVMMGTGPFILKEWVSDQVLRFEKNPNYWRAGEDGQPLPYLDGIEYIIAVDESARITDFLSGVTDMVWAVPEKDITDLKENTSIALAGPQSVWFSSIFFNTKAAPFDNKLVRQAISWAVDRDEICDVGLFGAAKPSYGAAFADWHWEGNGPKVYTKRDVEKAKALLAEAGFPDGKGIPEITIYAGAPYPSEITAAEMIAAYLADIGITAKVEPAEWGTFIDSIFAYKYPIYVVGWIGTGDPDDVYYQLFQSKSPMNLMQYNSPEVDALLEKARQTPIQSERVDFYHQLEAILLEDVPQAFLMWHDEYQALYPYVMNFKHIPNNSSITVPEIWLDKINTFTQYCVFKSISGEKPFACSQRNG